MGRFTPTDRPVSPLHVLAGGFDALSEGRARKEQKRRGRLGEALELARAREFGVMPGGQPEEAVSPERDVLSGARPGMAGQQQPQLISVLRAAGGLGLQRQQPEPKIVHPAGSFIRGVGFTEKAITDMDLVQHTQGRNAADPRMVPAEGTEPLNEDFHLDTSRTPQGRAEAQQRAESERLRRVLGGIQGAGRNGELDPELIAQGLEAGLPASQLFREPEEEKPRATRLVRSGNRNVLVYSDTGEPVREYDPIPTAGGRGAGDPGSNEVTRRSIATAAAREVARIQQELTSSVRPPDAGTVQRRIQAAITPYGFDSIDELSAEMRDLRIDGLENVPSSGAPPAPASDDEGEADVDLDFDQIDRWLEEGLTDEEITERLMGGAG